MNKKIFVYLLYGKLRLVLYTVFQNTFLMISSQTLIFKHKKIIMCRLTVVVVSIEQPKKRRFGRTPSGDLQIITRSIHAPVFGIRIAFYSRGATLQVITSCSGTTRNTQWIPRPNLLEVNKFQQRCGFEHRSLAWKIDQNLGYDIVVFYFDGYFSIFYLI